MPVPELNDVDLIEAASLLQADIAHNVSLFLPPFHSAAAASRTLQHALARRASEVLKRLLKLECSIAPSHKPSVFGQQRLLAFCMLRSSAAQAAANVCPGRLQTDNLDSEGACCNGGCEYTEHVMTPEHGGKSGSSESWLEDIDWHALSAKGARQMQETIEALAGQLPVRVVKHTRFGGNSGLYGISESWCETHIFFSLGRRALHFAFSEKCNDW